MTNIIDGMDAARFKSANHETRNRNKKSLNDNQNYPKKMPTVLKNLKNGS